MHILQEGISQRQPIQAWDGTHLVQAFHAAEQWLKQHVPAINRLNVFPVPDGDTGTNMHLTLAAALYGVTPAASCALVTDQVYRGALMGARGNSGVILSQILYGIAQALSNHDICGPVELAHALSRASTTAYLSTSDPREGTILTVIREMGEAAQQALKQAGADLLSVLSAAVEGARTAVERTPTLLKVLHDAGVVDAGGQGLYIIFEGMLRWARGESLTVVKSATDEQEMLTPAFTDVHGEDAFGYCTNLLLRGEGLPIEGIRHHMDTVGRSVVVVGDDSLVRLHIHTLRPGDILNYVMQYGELLRIEIANMDQQRAALHQHTSGDTSGVEPPYRDMQRISSLNNTARSTGRVGVVAVAPGKGFAEIFRSFGAGAVITGGQTMNPSTQDVLAAIESLPQDEVVILPNNSNVILAARQTVKLTRKHVGVIVSKTVPQGVAAMIRFNATSDLNANVAAMQEELAHVATAEITTAVRDAWLAGQAVRAGQFIALLDGELVVAGDSVEEVIDAVLERMDMGKRENLTIYYGQDVSVQKAQMLAERLQACYPEHEIEVRSGGQPVYNYILSAE